MSRTTFVELLDSAKQATQIGAEVLLKWRGRIHAQEKAPRDLVTEADLESQQAIRKFLLEKHSDHQFLGEESEADFAAPQHADSSDDQYCWIVDPLDGTTNYVHGMANFSVSIGLRRGSDVVLGVVYDPVSEEMFSAARGLGSHLNGRPITTSGCRKMSDAMVAVSFSTNVTRDSPEISSFIEILLASQVLRRLGSAALNLCYIADGRMDAYWASSVKIWDIAAGMVILEESGGEMTSLDGGSVELDRPRFVASATPELGVDIRQTLAQVKP